MKLDEVETSSTRDILLKQIPATYFSSIKKIQPERVPSFFFGLLLLFALLARCTNWWITKLVEIALYTFSGDFFLRTMKYLHNSENNERGFEAARIETLSFVKFDTWSFFAFTINLNRLICKIVEKYLYEGFMNANMLNLWQ